MTPPRRVAKPDRTDTPARARARGRARSITPKQRAGFLSALAQGQTVTASAALAGVDRRQALYELRGRDERFADAWDLAVEEGVQALEQEAWRRAVDGVDRPVYQGGALVGTVREFSDVLLQFLLRAKRPGVYRDRFKHEHEHRGRVDLRLDRLSDRELAQLERLVDKASDE